MDVYHLNCGTIASLKLRGESLVSHCLLIRSDSDGLILVDTGLGRVDRRLPSSGFGFGAVEVDDASLISSQIIRIGFKPEQVKHIILTHLDGDHVGGLRDFSEATVHLLADELNALQRPVNEQEGQRYSAQWFRHEPKFVSYQLTSETQFDLPVISHLTGIHEPISLMPLIGHSRGHSGVLIHHDGQWLLHAGDAYFDPDELGNATWDEPALSEFEERTQWDATQRLSVQQQLAELRQTHPEVQLFSTHNPQEFHNFQR